MNFGSCRNWHPVFSSCKGGALFSGHQGPKNRGTCFEKGYPCKHEHEGNTASLEDISFLLRVPQRKPYGTMEGNVKKALKIAVDEKDFYTRKYPNIFEGEGFNIICISHRQEGIRVYFEITN
ncbi:hypothetical protein Q3G72_026992 [Acer saccharum]|nr:hypothetical protein Q3G72_026992 [Acer saccharum]